MKTFKELNLGIKLVKTFDRFGFKTPTEIQEKSIPRIVAGEDLVGESATGSGKTLAFACGVIEKTVPGKGLQALILTPTRELAEQVKNEIIKLSYGRRLEISAIYGGTPMGPQVNALRYADVVIATPGRLLDHLNRRTINISRIKLLVLDEADRMLDMGFINDVKKIIQFCPSDRQTLFFSATISPEIQELAKRFTKNAYFASAANQVDPTKLRQVFYDVPKNQKLSLLAHLLEEEESDLVLVFCNTRRNTDFVHNQLVANGINATAIHGGLSQNQRARTLRYFSDNRAEVLICTDVAARGLHIENVSHVYNYDLPRNPIDYVHRIGRTARVGEKGKVINLLCPEDYPNLRSICRKYNNFRIEDLQMPEIKKRLTVVVRPRREFSPQRGRGGFRPQHRPGGSGNRYGGGGRSGGGQRSNYGSKRFGGNRFNRPRY